MLISRTAAGASICLLGIHSRRVPLLCTLRNKHIAYLHILPFSSMPAVAAPSTISSPFRPTRHVGQLDMLPEAHVNTYRVEHKPGERVVSHLTPGPTVPGCQGMWKVVDRLRSEYTDSVVEVQRLVAAHEGGSAGGSSRRGSARLEPPPTFRAVKRLRLQQMNPAADQRPMIHRGLLCMARANVSRCILSARALGTQLAVQGFQNLRGCTHAVLVRRRHVHPHRNGVLRLWQFEGLDPLPSVPG